MPLADTAQLVVDLKLNDQLSGGIARAESSLGGFHTAVGRAGTAVDTFKGRMGQLVSSPLGMLGMVGGMYGVVQATKDVVTSAMSFNSAMDLIQTQAGGTAEEVKTMSEAILGMSASVGTGPAELAAGLYHIESAGLRGAQALDILKTAAEGAKVGNADLESVTNALIASTQSGIGGVQNMSQAMGVLNAIVGAGNMRMQDLTDAFSTGILSSAKAFGVSIQSVGAALADMTIQGVPATDAATRLRMTISLLGAPTGKAVDELKRIGIGSSDLANAMRGPGGILDAVAMLKDHLDKSGLSATQQAQLISNAFGGGRSSSAILSLLGSLDKFRTVQDQVVAGTGKFDAAWQKTTQEAEFSWAKFQAVVGTLAIRLGDAILPTVVEALNGISDWANANSQGITDAFKSAISVARGFGSAIKEMLPTLAGIAQGAKAMWSAIPAPLRDILIKGVVVDRTVKFLFGMSPIEMVGGAIAGSLKGALGGITERIFGRGSPTNPMFVVPMGGGLGGGVGNVAEAAGGVGAATVLGAAAITAIAAAAVVGFKSIVLDPGLNKQSGGIVSQTQAEIAANRTDTAKLQVALDGVTAGLKKMNPENPLSQVLYGQQISDLRTAQSALQAQIQQNKRVEHSGSSAEAKVEASNQKVIKAQQAGFAALIHSEHADQQKAINYAASQVAWANKIANSGRSTEDKIAALQRLQREVGNKSAVATQAIATRIAHLKPPIVNVTTRVGVSVTDIAGKSHTTVMHGNVVHYGNRPVGVGMGAT